MASVVGVASGIVIVGIADVSGHRRRRPRSYYSKRKKKISNEKKKKKGKTIPLLKWHHCHRCRQLLFKKNS